MAYQAGTLLAAGGDVYEQLMDIIKAFAETAGWTTNLYDDDSSYYETTGTYHASGGYAGKRLHMQKSINGTVRCINIKSCFNECPTYHVYSTSGLVSGLALNGSTGFAATNVINITSVENAGSGKVYLYCTNTGIITGQSITVAGTTDYNGVYTVDYASSNYIRVVATYTSSQTGTITFVSRWEKQTGTFTSSGNYLASAVSRIPTDILNYYLIHIVDGLADIIYLQVQNSKGYIGFVFGTTSLDVFVVGGSSCTFSENTNTEDINSLLYFAYGDYSLYSFMALYTGGAYNGWYALMESTQIGVKLPYQRLVSIYNDHEAHLLLYCSPDNFKGNAPLIPVNLQLINSSSVKVDLGILPGIKYINMKNIASLREETYGGDTYKLFRQYNVDNAYEKFGGLAFLIS